MYKNGYRFGVPVVYAERYNKPYRLITNTRGFIMETDKSVHYESTAPDKQRDNSGIISRFIQKLKTNRKLEIGVYAALGSLALIIYLSSVFSGSTKNDTADTTTELSAISVSDNDIEERLSNALSNIRGAGRVTVMITYDTTAQIVPAMSTESQTGENSSSDSSSRDSSDSSTPATVTRDGNEEPIVLTQIEPTVRGVIVIAEGAADISVRMNLQHAVETVLGIDADCIEVFEMDMTNINN